MSCSCQNQPQYTQPQQAQQCSCAQQTQTLQYPTTQCQPACQQSCAQQCSTSSSNNCQQNCQSSCQASCSPAYNPTPAPAVSQCQPACQQQCQQSCVAQQQPVAQCSNQCQQQCDVACDNQQPQMQQTIQFQITVPVAQQSPQCQPQCQQQCQDSCTAQQMPAAQCSNQCQSQCSDACNNNYQPSTPSNQCAPACQPACQPSCTQQYQPATVAPVACMPQCQNECQTSCVAQQQPAAQCADQCQSQCSNTCGVQQQQPSTNLPLPSSLSTNLPCRSSCLYATVPEPMPIVVRCPATTSGSMLRHLQLAMLAELWFCSANGPGTSTASVHSGLHANMRQLLCCRSATDPTATVVVRSAMPVSVRPQPATSTVPAVPICLQLAELSSRPGRAPVKHRSELSAVPASVRVQLRLSMHPAESANGILPASLPAELQQLVPSSCCCSTACRRRLSAIHEQLRLPMPNRLLSVRQQQPMLPPSLTRWCLANTNIVCKYSSIRY
ncbi:cysteine rich repeat-containing domain protein [Teladorsagia circumcincta]|uniref:Cysteine rich repeat-containing domain protein n=1 Tax=Teladorsagia circumcincta TaxID=45464 RepID=A0A2G9TPY8_TELCI|nr:cysteine rich repeat-containing domain protein [Teladorsagia circumcincta]